MIHLTTKFTLIVEKSQSLEITLNRPEVKNAFHPEMILELISIFKEIDLQKNQIAKHKKYILLKSSGDAFCAGADLNWMYSMKNYSLEDNYKDASQLEQLFASIRTCVFPVIALVQGGCFGGGVGLVAACDIVIANNKNASFCLSEVKLGLAPSVISPYVVAKIGVSQFKYYALTGHIINATEANTIGLVHQLVSNEDWGNSEFELEKHFSKLPTTALQHIKSLSHKLESSLFNSEITHFTTELISRIRLSQEAQEGMGSLLEKRKPNWILS